MGDDLRALTLGDAPALTRIYSGASVRTPPASHYPSTRPRRRSAAPLHGRPRRRGRSGAGAILAADEMIGLIALRRRSPVMGTISYILGEDTWGNGYATNAATQVVAFAGQARHVRDLFDREWAGLCCQQAKALHVGRVQSEMVGDGPVEHHVCRQVAAGLPRQLPVQPGSMRVCHLDPTPNCCATQQFPLVFCLAQLMRRAAISPLEDHAHRCRHWSHRSPGWGHRPRAAGSRPPGSRAHPHA
ncbi:GNAT family N-acetyltransferase [Streptomyces sp. XY332]|uniref:GNAT family N-acetyltransferase n=1 Tax=Streptomyces sp. XY332 TaxID=1415561 RepID=UPI00099CE2C9